MHHRYYDPQLGHFLNPDFRAPDIYDPTTFTEPYAYAAGNPMMFWDPDGLAGEQYYSFKDPYTGNKELVRIAPDQLIKAKSGESFEYERSTNWLKNLIGLGWEKGTAVLSKKDHHLPFSQQLALGILGGKYLAYSSSAPVTTGGLPFTRVFIDYGATTKVGPFIVGYEQVTLERFSGRSYEPFDSVEAEFMYIGFGPEYSHQDHLGWKELKERFAQESVNKLTSPSDQILKLAEFYMKNGKNLGPALKGAAAQTGIGAVNAASIYMGEGWYHNTTYEANDPDFMDKYTWNGYTVSYQPLAHIAETYLSAVDMGPVPSQRNIQPFRPGHLWSVNMARTSYFALTDYSDFPEEHREMIQSYNGGFLSFGAGYGPAGVNYFRTPFPYALPGGMVQGMIIDEMAKELALKFNPE